MGEIWPKFPQDVQDGDEVSHAPTKNDRSLLGTERGTQSTRRFEMDAERNLYTNIGADSRTEGLLYSTSLSAVVDSTPTAFVAYTAPSAKKVYKILLSGQGAADYTLRLNAGTIGVRRTNLDLDVEFTFEKGLSLVFGDALDVVVDHCSIGNTKDFDLFVYGA